MRAHRLNRATRLGTGLEDLAFPGRGQHCAGSRLGSSIRERRARNVRGPRRRPGSRAPRSVPNQSRPLRGRPPRCEACSKQVSPVAPPNRAFRQPRNTPASHGVRAAESTPSARTPPADEIRWAMPPVPVSMMGTARRLPRGPPAPEAGNAPLLNTARSRPAANRLSQATGHGVLVLTGPEPAASRARSLSGFRSMINERPPSPRWRHADRAKVRTRPHLRCRSRPPSPRPAPSAPRRTTRLTSWVFPRTSPRRARASRRRSCSWRA